MPGAPSEWVPDWYPFLRAAKWLGVPPWELLDRPAFWWHRAFMAEQAEIAGEQAAIARASTPQPSIAPVTF